MKKGNLKRGQIMDAAEALFFDRGYDRTSVQDILDATQMSKGGFYHYFDAKDSVLKAVSERRMQARFDRLAAELHASRRTPVDRMNLLLGMTNLFEAEEPPFAALMMKLCYRDKDAAMREHRRRVLVDGLLGHVEGVIDEGIADDSFHSRHPRELARLLLLLACDVDDEVCALLADRAEDPDVMLELLDLLNAWRESAENLLSAPYGSIRLFDAGRLVNAWQAGLAMLKEQEARAL